MATQQPSLQQTPHLLEWYASYCAIEAENCEHPRVEKFLRALSVDLALEAEKFRRMVRQTTPFGGSRGEQTRALFVELALRAERSRVERELPYGTPNAA